MGGLSPGELAKLRTRSPDDNAVRVFLYAQASRAERARPWDASSISSDCVGQGEVRRGRKKTDGPDGMGVPCRCAGQERAALTSTDGEEGNDGVYGRTASLHDALNHPRNAQSRLPALSNGFFILFCVHPTVSRM